MLKQRLITAIVLIPIVLLLLFFAPPWLFVSLMSVIVLAAASEWTHLIGIKKASLRFLYLFIVLAACSAMMFVPILYIFLCAFIWWLIATVLIILYPRGTTCWHQNVWVKGLMGVLVLVPCWAAVNYIRNQPDGVYSLLYLFILIWGADSAAYFVGKKWGKHKLAPKVSPGKSIQGFIGALIFAFAIVMAVVTVFDIPSSLWMLCIALSLITVIFSVIGDLFESMMKREAGVKDSGHILPGHGGMLDRIDSLTAAAPIFVLGSFVLGMYAGQ